MTTPPPKNLAATVSAPWLGHSPRSHVVEPRDKQPRRPGSVIAAVFPRRRTSRQTDSAPWLGHRRAPTPQNRDKRSRRPASAIAALPRRRTLRRCVPSQPAPAARRSQFRTHGAPRPLLVNKAHASRATAPRFWRGKLGRSLEDAGNGGADPATSHCRIIKTWAVPNWRGPKSTAPSNNALHRTRFARR